MTSLKDEESFPRGRSSSSKPVLRKVKNSLFKKHKKPKKKSLKNSLFQENKLKGKFKKGLANGQSNLTPSHAITPLTYQKLEEGMVIVGRIREIHPYHMFVCLPGKLSARVHITAVSQPYSDSLGRLQKLEITQQDCPPLAELFTIGQSVVCSIVDVKKDGDILAVNASLDPALVNRERSHHFIKAGHTLVAAVRTIEDHGYTLYTGIAGLTTFLKFGNATKHVELMKQGRPLVVGELVRCVVTKCTTARSASRALVTLDPRVVAQTAVSEGNDQTLHPGTPVSCVVQESTRAGLVVTVGRSRAYVEASQMPSCWSSPKHFQPEEELTATVVYSLPNIDFQITDRPTYLTLKDLSRPTIPRLGIGETMQAKVTASGRKGLVLCLGDKKDKTLGNKGFVSIRRLGEVIPKENIANKFPKGTVVTTKILGYDYMEEIYNCTLERAKLDQHYVSVAQVRVGDRVTCRVEGVEEAGLRLVLGPVRMFAFREHAADDPPDDLRLHFVVGDTVDARVLKVNIPSHQVYVTLKETLIRSPALTSYEMANGGDCYWGTVRTLNEDGSMYVTFYNDVAGILALEGESASAYRVGQLVKCYVSKVHSGARKLTLSLKKPRERNPRAQLRFGEFYQLVVTNTNENFVNVSPCDFEGIKGLIPKSHLHQPDRFAEGDFIRAWFYYKENNIHYFSPNPSMEYFFKNASSVKPKYRMTCVVTEVDDKMVSVLTAIPDIPAVNIPREEWPREERPTAHQLVRLYVAEYDPEKEKLELKYYKSSKQVNSYKNEVSNLTEKKVKEEKEERKNLSESKTKLEEIQEGSGAEKDTEEIKYNHEVLNGSITNKYLKSEENQHKVKKGSKENLIDESINVSSVDDEGKLYYIDRHGGFEGKKPKYNILKKSNEKKSNMKRKNISENENETIEVTKGDESDFNTSDFDSDENSEVIVSKSDKEDSEKKSSVERKNVSETETKENSEGDESDLNTSDFDTDVSSDEPVATRKRKNSDCMKNGNKDNKVVKTLKKRKRSEVEVKKENKSDKIQNKRKSSMIKSNKEDSVKKSTVKRKNVFEIETKISKGDKIYPNTSSFEFDESSDDTVATKKTKNSDSMKNGNKEDKVVKTPKKQNSSESEMKVENQSDKKQKERKSFASESEKEEGEKKSNVQRKNVFEIETNEISKGDKIHPNTGRSEFDESFDDSVATKKTKNSDGMKDGNKEDKVVKTPKKQKSSESEMKVVNQSDKKQKERISSVSESEKEEGEKKSNVQRKNVFEIERNEISKGDKIHPNTGRSEFDESPDDTVATKKTNNSDGMKDGNKEDKVVKTPKKQKSSESEMKVVNQSDKKQKERISSVSESEKEEGEKKSNVQRKNVFEIERNEISKGDKIHPNTGRSEFDESPDDTVATKKTNNSDGMKDGNKEDKVVKTPKKQKSSESEMKVENQSDKKQKERISSVSESEKEEGEKKSSVERKNVFEIETKEISKGDESDLNTSDFDSDDSSDETVATRKRTNSDRTENGNKEDEVVETPKKRKSSEMKIEGKKQKERKSSVSESEIEEQKKEIITPKYSANPKPTLSETGFMWDIKPEDLNKTEEGATDDDEEDEDWSKEKKKKKTAAERRQAAKEEEARLRQVEQTLLETENNPQSADQFDRAVLARPDDDELWIKYMSHHLQATEIEKARAVARRALQTISQRLEVERLNIWIALLNLEHLFGTQESLKNTLDEALRTNDEYSVYTKMLNIYSQANKAQEAEQLSHVMLRKFRESQECWVACCAALMRCGLADKARNLLQRAITALPAKQHVNLLCKFALLENQHGNSEQAQTLFEHILTTYPKRTDIWNVYVDMLVKSEKVNVARQILDRATKQKLPPKKMKMLFNKWISFEEKHGTPEKVENVRKQALAYLNNLTNKLDDSS